MQHRQIFRNQPPGSDVARQGADALGCCGQLIAVEAVDAYRVLSQHGAHLRLGNSLEGLAFYTKDALLLIDDFAPTGTPNEVQRFHREADRVLRAQGNNAGRGRMRADSSLKPPRPPRGLIVSTGEDIPRGQSLRARLLTLELGPIDVDWSRLTMCQADASTGLYALFALGMAR